jgi:F-type H+-transporting ATPase subunit a
MQHMLRSLSRLIRVFTLAAATVAAAPLVASAQEHGAEAAAHTAAPAGEKPVDFITPHITDSRHLEIPALNSHLAAEVELPKWEPIHIGGMSIDLSPTKHVVFMLLAAVIVSLLLIVAGNASKKQHAAHGHAKGFAGAIEAMALYLRNEVVLPNVGHHGEGFVPFALTLFFFILVCNLLGMLPWGATATGNIAVTATLAIITAVIVEVAGIRANGLGYLNTIFYWNKDLPLVMRILMFFVMTPVEIVGKIGIIFTFKSWALAPVPVLMATAISMLELFVAFLQAFIFTLLASVFIGQIREAHH